MNYDQASPRWASEYHGEADVTDERQSEDKPRAAPGTATGQPVTPAPGEEPMRPADPGAVQEIPIGMPMSPEEYRRLKERAEAPGPREVGAAGDEADEDVPEGGRHHDRDPGT